MAVAPAIPGADLDAAIIAFRNAVGGENVFTSEEDLDLYRDAYSPLWGEPEERLAGAAVAPNSVEEVRAVVRIAAQYRVPLYPISTGKNLGYGGSAPNLSGSVVLDLKRMNRIIEVDEKRNFAIVEPGVSYFDLYNYIKERGLKVMIDVPDPGWGGVVGNPLDHGVGHTWYMYRDHFFSHCGLEVVLPDGDLLRTGMGAGPNSKAWADFRYNFGPYVDGLFGQAGFGVVTKMGIHLMPQVDHFLHRKIYVPRRQDLIPLVDIANKLEDQGMIGMPLYESPMFPLQYSDAELGAIAKQPDVWNGNAINRYASEKGVMPWKVGFSFYGPESINEAKWEYAWDLVRTSIPGATFEDYDSVHFPVDDAREDAIKDKVLTGVPNMNIFTGGARSRTNRDPSDGHMLFAPTFERSGETVLKAQEIFATGLQELGISYARSYSPFTAPYSWNFRAFVLATGMPVSRSDPKVNQRSREAMLKLVKLGAEHGFYEYRTPPLFQDEVMDTFSFNDNALRRFCEKLKDAVDPDGVVSPGRGGFWPSRFRD